MNEYEFRFKFDGAEANQSRVSAKAGTETLSGFAAALARVAHYVAEGEVKFREPFSNNINFYLSHTETGSLDFVFLAIKRGVDKSTKTIRDLSKLTKEVLEVATGQTKATNLELSNRVASSGDIEALAESIEPSLRRAHNWIDGRVKNLTISTYFDDVVELNKDTKEYLSHEDIDEYKDVQDVSVGALNVNSRNGRVYFHDIGRTVSFYVSKQAETRTIPTLSRYLSEYADKTGATVNIQFKRIRYADQRLKKIIIYDCYPIDENQ